MCAMPEPAPPRVKDGRITTGYLRLCVVARHWSMSWQIWLRGTSAPRPPTISLNLSRSSPALIASMLAPISSTSYFCNTPWSCRATAALSAVWPPRVGSTASGRWMAMTFSSVSVVIGST